MPVRPCLMLDGYTILKLRNQFTGSGPLKFVLSSPLPKAVLMSNFLYILSDLCIF